MTDDTDARDDASHLEVGSLAEEVAKLFGTVSGWAREHGAEAGQGLSDAARHATATVHDVDEHLANGSPECTVCPLCRAVHAVRGLSPEVRSHLSAAVTSVAQAASAFLSTQPPGPGEPAGRGPAKQVDLDEE